MGRISKFLALDWDSPSIPRVFHKSSREEGTVHTWWGEQSNIKGEKHFWLEGRHGGIILRDNPAGHCFVLRDLVPTSLFNQNMIL